MSELGTYSFLPWLRQGLANQITAQDNDANVKLRASVAVNLEAKGDPLGGGAAQTRTVSRNVALYGPGDITGIDRRTVVRTEPRDWITNFESNFLPAIEFYDEDLPWRYTPATPNAQGRLRPWIALVVLEEGEFSEGTNTSGRPLPYVDATDLSVFPKADELWAWAHVHVNRSLAGSDEEHVSSDMAAVMPRLQGVLSQDPDLAYSRLIAPRRLLPNRAYHAFVMPSFEAGRRAGLGLELGDIAATASAWEAPGRPAPASFPYYYRWYFRTADTGDFESLVRLLVPRPVDLRVGFRDMDMLAPGSDVTGFTSTEENGVLRLGGALQPPIDTPDPSDDWDQAFPHPLQDDLSELINLPDDYITDGFLAEADQHPDPIIAPPLYGRWHAMTKRIATAASSALPATRDRWLQRLNLDPRFRAAAGIGTRVIQDGQESYMDAAWDQIGKVLAAQRKIWAGQFGLLTSLVWHEKHFVPTLAVSKDKSLQLIAPLAKRIVLGGSTVHAAMAQSLVQPAMTSAALRRITRPRGRLIRKLPFTPDQPAIRLIERVDAGEVSAAPPRETPPGLITDADAGAAIASGIPDFIVNLLHRFPNLPWLALILAFVLALFLLLFGFVVPALAMAGLGVVAWFVLSRWAKRLAAAETSGLDGLTPGSVDALPNVPDFEIGEPANTAPPRPGAIDSVEAARFKEALRETAGILEKARDAGRKPVRRPLGLATVATDGLAAINPRRTISRRIMRDISIPSRIVDDLIFEPADIFVEPMAYPVIDKPMYEPLKELSDELFLPNIHLIQPNTITLLKTNQRFIESYMVGLNHEFSRELLWREYPTDQRGSSFRQFWDVKSYFSPETLDDDALKEKLRDITPLHRWSTTSKLGQHDNRDVPGSSEEELVLAIRGELLKRYPNAVVYAHRAAWQRKPANPAENDLDPVLRTGPIDPTVERRLAPLSASEADNPPRDKVQTPLYSAKIDPDITFFGFDLTRQQVEGGTGANPNDDPGWFFVIKERPGEPRFGLDLDGPDTLSCWNDLSWSRFQPGPEAANILVTKVPDTLPITLPSTADEQFDQAEEDVKIVWNKASITSAELAYILFQAPVLVGVHAKDMLPTEL